MDLKCETLDLLIEDCLLKIFKLLTFEDLMNVAETCTKFKSVADSLFKKHSLFVLDHGQRGSRLAGETVPPNKMKRILKHTGHHVTSLEIRYYSDDFPCSAVLDRIDCSKLKQLQIFYWNPFYENVFKSHCFDNLELFSNFFPNLNTVLAGLNKLKCLNIDPSEINFDDLKLVLRNNTNLESFVVYARCDFDFNCQLLQMIPTVQKLALCCENGNISNVNLLPTFENLTTLQLNCMQIDVSEFLGRLTQPTLLKELEVHCVPLVSLQVNLLKVLGRFDNLELLHLDAVSNMNEDPSNFIMAKSILWPPSIKRLYLHNVPITRTICCSIIRQLKSLEQFDAFFLLGTNNADIVFRNISKLLVGRQQKLHLALPWCFDFTFGEQQSQYKSRLSIESDQLKLFHDEEDENNSMGIHPKFPGVVPGMLHCNGCLRGVIIKM